MFNIDPKKTGSINDGGRKLKIGTFAYKITDAKSAIVKSNPTGKEQQVVIDLLHGKDYSCKVFLNVMSPNDVTCDIAQKTLAAFWEAAGLSGTIKPERLGQLKNKFVEITARETLKDGKTYSNISTVEAVSDNEETSDDDDAEEETEEESEEEETEDTEEEEEEEETPPPASKKKAAPAAGQKKRPW